MANLVFDATQVAPQESFTPIPAGIYIAQAIDSEVKPLKSGNGQALNLTFEVLDGQFKGRKVFSRLNIQHTNQQAEQIGQKQLSQLCHAAGVLKVNDSAQLHQRPVRIKVKIRKDETGQYGDQNEIAAFESVGNVVPTTAPSGAFVPAPPAAPAAPTTPWGQKAAA